MDANDRTAALEATIREQTAELKRQADQLKKLQADYDRFKELMTAIAKRVMPGIHIP